MDTKSLSEMTQKEFALYVNERRKYVEPIVYIKEHYIDSINRTDDDNVGHLTPAFRPTRSSITKAIMSVLNDTTNVDITHPHVALEYVYQLENIKRFLSPERKEDGKNLLSTLMPIQKLITPFHKLSQHISERQKCIQEIQNRKIAVAKRMIQLVLNKHRLPDGESIVKHAQSIFAIMFIAYDHRNNTSTKNNISRPHEFYIQCKSVLMAVVKSDLPDSDKIAILDGIYRQFSDTIRNDAHIKHVFASVIEEYAMIQLIKIENKLLTKASHINITILENSKNQLDMISSSFRNIMSSSVVKEKLQRLTDQLDNIIIEHNAQVNNAQAIQSVNDESTGESTVNSGNLDLLKKFNKSRSKSKTEHSRLLSM